MHSRHNTGSVVAERFIRTLKNKIYKYMTSISKNVYTDKLDDIVNEYNNTYHTTIKMKPIGVKDNTYVNIDKKINNKDPKLKVGDRFKVFLIKEIKNTVPWTYVINDLNCEETIGKFYGTLL